MMKNYKGLTLMLAVGSYGGFHFLFKETVWRFCLGWIAFSIIFLDFENLACDVINSSKEKNIFK